MGEYFSMKTFYAVLFVLLAFHAHAQFSYELYQEVEVEAGGNLLNLPWAGGLNSAQVNSMDINGDSKEDLVIFDRTANKLLTFVNENNQLKAAPEYESLFPSEVSQ